MTDTQPNLFNTDPHRSPAEASQVVPDMWGPVDDDDAPDEFYEPLRPSNGDQPWAADLETPVPLDMYDDASGGSTSDEDAPSEPTWRAYDAWPEDGPFTTVLTDGAPDEYLTGLNEGQRDAVNALNGPVLVVAGPGSGKTRVLTHRIASLLALGVPPWRILAVTFTNKAAAEMRERIGKLVGDEQAAKLWMSTFHSMCVKILRRDGESLGLRRSFGIADSDDARRVIRRLLVADGMETREATRNADEFASAISLAKNKLMTPDQMRIAGDPEMRAASFYYDRYANELAAQNLLDFDDLLLKTKQLLERHPAVAARYRERFSHILVDEYQDTNACQYEIVRSLVGSGRNLCVVGDADQAVYGWRGATSESLEGFDRDFPEATVVVLDRNYRSTPSILEVARAVIAPNPAPHRAQLWTENEPGAAVRLRAFVDDRDEARHVVREIRASLTAGTPPADHAILYRTNALSRTFEAELTASSIPYIVVGGQRFFERAEVKDALAYLRVITNDRDVASFTRAATVPRRRLGEATINLIAATARRDDSGLVTAARRLLAAGELGRGTKPTASFLDDIDSVIGSVDDGPEATVAAVLAVPGFVEAATTGAARELAGEARRENLDQLVSAVSEFCARPPEDLAAALGVERGTPLTPSGDVSGFDLLSAFVEHVALVSAVDVEENAAVQLMTAHASKGREFARVWVVGVEADLFPHSSSQSDSAVAEERRLLFVAVSRAQRTLEMSWCATRFRFGDVIQTSPSPFLADLPESVEYTSAPSGSTRSSRDGWARGTARRQSLSGSWSPQSAHASTRKSPARAAAVPAGPRVSSVQLTVGAMVDHPSFGTGTVRSFDATTATVAFADKTRTLLLDQAPLTVTG